MAFPLSDQEHAAIKTRIEAQPEIIVGAAIKVRSGSGWVVVMAERPGRHGDCIGFLHNQAPGVDYREHQGFVTNRGRFVDRAEAGRIVLAAQQGSPGGTPANNPKMHLYSEDMWNDWEVTPTAPIDPETIFGEKA